MKILNRHLLVLSVMAVFTFTACGSDSPGAAVDTEIDLSTELDSVGNTVTLPSNADVAGVVVDTNGDNQADGLDLDGNQADAEVIYLSGSLGKPGAGRSSARGFYFSTNPDITYFFVVSSNRIAFSTDSSGTNTKLQIIVDETTGEVAGIDQDGDGTVSAEEDSSLNGIVIVYASSNPVVALFTTVPGAYALPGTVSFKVGNVDSFSYSLNGAAYSADTDASQPVSFTLAVGQNTLKVIGKKNGKTQSADRPTTHKFQVANFYKITVSNADTANTNKTTAAAAVELWAVTTMYESVGYESEKVRLKRTSTGDYEGYLVALDDTGRTVIVFDDVITAPVIVNGTVDSNISSGGAGSYNKAATDDYFSPCWDIQLNLAGTVTNLWDAWITTDSGSLTAPIIPGFFQAEGSGLSSASATDTNDEVFTTSLAPVLGGELSVDYTSFAKGLKSNYCEAPNAFVYAKAYNVSYGAFSNYYHSPQVTDNNFSQTGGSIIDRFPAPPL